MHAAEHRPGPVGAANGAARLSTSRARLTAACVFVSGLAGAALAATALARGAGTKPWSALLVAGALLVLSACVVAVALVRWWSEGQRQLGQRVAELSALEEVGRAMAQAQFDVAALCRLLYEHTSQIVDATIFHLGLFDGDTYTIRLWMQKGKAAPERTFRMTPGVGLVNWLRESKRPLLVRDFEKEMESLPARPVHVAENPPRSALFVPLLAGETVIGTLTVQSYRPHAYGPSDERVLSAMANQAALAIQKARLFEEERRRARQLQTIGQVSRQVTATLELSELFRQTVRLVRESFGYYHVGIFTADRETRRIDFQASASAGGQDVVVSVPWGEGLIGWVAAQGKSVIANDVLQDEHYRALDALEETRSEVVVPLCLENELVGVLDVQSDRPHAFGAEDLLILETVGAQVAIAIQEARLYEAEKEQAWMATALLQVADTLSQLSDMGDILSTVVRVTPMMVGVDRCGILLWDGDAEAFLPSQSYGLSPEERGRFAEMRFPVGSLPLLDQLRQEKSPILVERAEENTLLPLDIAEAFQVGRMVALPLVAQGELLGALVADHAARPAPIDERIMAMLSGLAHQAAMAMQSARLLQVQEEEAYTSMALLQVADAVSHSTELSESLAAVLRITPMLIGVDACMLFLQDPESGSLLPYEHYGLSGQAEAAFRGLPGLDEQPTWQLLGGRRYATAGAAPRWDGLEDALAGAALVLLPVDVRGETVGLLGMARSGSFSRLTERRISVLAGIADQIGVAIETNRLIQEAAEQERIKQELEVAKRIQASFLPESCPSIPGWEVAAIWRSAREVAGDFYDFIALPPEPGQQLGRMGIAIADVADKGVPAALFMALSRTLLRTMAIAGRPPAGAVAMTNNLILADARAELFVTLFYTILEPESGRISYVNAGHPPSLLVRSASGEIEELRIGGMALGVLPDQVYEERSAQMEPGDVLILYTDGIIEAGDSAGRLFGRKRLAEAASAHRHEPAVRLGESLEAAVAAHAAGAPQSDDLTLVVVKRQSTASQRHP